jgi:hypothetical protein
LIYALKKIFSKRKKIIDFVVTIKIEKARKKLRAFLYFKQTNL